MGYCKRELEIAMKRKGVSRAELAKVLGISLTSLQYKINGIREFKGSQIYTVCEYLEVENKDVIFFNSSVD